MAIYTCFIQHVVNSLKKTGKGAIVVPTGFITAKSGVEKSVLQKHLFYFIYMNMDCVFLGFFVFRNNTNQKNWMPILPCTFRMSYNIMFG